MDQWFVGCNVNYVVCEGPSMQRYLGHCNNLVTVSSPVLHFYYFLVTILYSLEQWGLSLGQSGLAVYILDIICSNGD